MQSSRSSVLEREVEDVSGHVTAVGVVGRVVVVDVAVHRADGAVEAHLQLREDVPVEQTHVECHL